MDDMKMTKGLFSSESIHWATPKELYDSLDSEFQFNDDPCPLYGNGGLDRDWGTSTYCNPPYGRKICLWLEKALKESTQGKTVVCLIPSRTDTKWWHDYVMKASEIRFLKGRLKFGGSKNTAPFPSALAIFRGMDRRREWLVKCVSS
jgi:site-specific DNA-methyltransferase (adenine-specific)